MPPTKLEKISGVVAGALLIAALSGLVWAGFEVARLLG